MEKITLEVVNIKCGGCAKTIIKALKELNCKNVSVSPDTQIITFDLEKLENIEQEEKQKIQIIKKLEDLGYPLKDSELATSFLKKAKSYASCAVGKFL